MISRSQLMGKLRRELSPPVFKILPESFINEILHDEALKRFSDWYPLLCDIRITADNAIPYRDYSGRIFNYSTYKIPHSFSVPGIDTKEEFVWRDLEDYQIGGNDQTDVLSGGNFLLNSMFLSARSSMPHTRSYYIIRFQEPDLLIVNPPMQVHRNFNVTMQADRTLHTIPRNLERYFQDYFIALMKYYTFNRLKYESGTQVFAGVEIDTKIAEFESAKSDIERLEADFEKDYYKSAQRFDVICLYQKKG